MLPASYRVVARRVEIEPDPSAGIDEVVTLDLASGGADHGAPFETPQPGQFFMLWAPGVGEVPISTSIVRGDVLGFTVRSVGSTTAKLCATPIGAPVGLRGPFGRPWSDPGADVPTVVVAGGIGLAPLRLHIEALLSRESGSSGPLSVIVGARSPAEILYPAEIERWSQHCDVHVTVDRATPGWTGEVGLVTSPLRRLDVREGTAAALCGPEIMMRLASADLVESGADPELVELTMERSMACAVAHCGRCQLGPVLLCRDGPVFSWSEAEALMAVRRW